MTDHSQATPTVSPMLDAALAYAAAGYRVFPVRHGTKVPEIKEWQNLATADPAQVAAWFGRGRHNIGIATGPQPSGHNLFVIDVDPAHNGMETWVRITEPHGGLEPWQLAPIHWTRNRGLHFFCDAPSDLRNSRGRLGEGIDTRGDGGYVIAPPSMVPLDDGTLRHYDCSPGWGLLDREPIWLPEWCVELLVAERPVLRVVPSTNGDYTGQSAFDWVRHHESWDVALARHGWTLIGSKGGDSTWKRPGKTDHGGSATLHGDGPLVVWTTDVPPELEALGKDAGGSGFSISLPDFICAYEYGGDRSAMARDITRRNGLAPRVEGSPRGGTAEGTQDTRHTGPTPSVRHLPEEFWNARPVLGQIRQAARARMVGPDATLLNVLIRYAATIPPGYKLPPIVGGYGTLDLLGCVVGKTSSGKSKTMSCARDLLPGVDKDIRWDLPLGSGEGISQAFMVDEVDEKGKKTGKQRVGVRACHFVVDEGMAMAEVASRKGTTIIPTINSAITGEGLGQANAGEANRRIIPPGLVRFSCVINIQAENAHVVFTPDMVRVGFTGRLIFTRANDPGAPDVEPEWPGPLNLHRWPIITSGVDITYDPAIAAEIRAARRIDLRDDTDEGSGASHSMLLRCKISSLLALIEGRRNVNLDDWALGGMLISNSAGVYSGLDQLRRSQESAALRARGHTQAAIAEVVEDRAEARASARRREWVVRKVLTSPEGSLTVGDLRRQARSTDRPFIEDAIEAACAEGRLAFDGTTASKA